MSARGWHASHWPAFWPLALCLALVGGASHARAPRSHALLVGIAEYAMPAWPALPGVANDVRLMREMLIKRGFAANDIRVLANGIDADWVTGAPTRAGLISEFRRLRREARKGDQVVFYYAGHGSQVPAWRGRGRNNEEPDGFDEIILMADSGPWLERARAVDNAVLDDEIDQELISALRAVGVDTVAIFDTCHAESMVRGVDTSGGLPTRNLDWVALGIPTRWLAARAPDSAPAESGESHCRGSMQADRRRAGGPGNLVALYAVAENRGAPEGLFETAAGPTRHGVFTWRMTQRLNHRPNRSYRELVKDLELEATPDMKPCAQIEGALGDRNALSALR